MDLKAMHINTLKHTLILVNPSTTTQRSALKPCEWLLHVCRWGPPTSSRSAFVVPAFSQWATASADYGNLFIKSLFHLLPNLPLYSFLPPHFGHQGTEVLRSCCRKISNWKPRRLRGLAEVQQITIHPLLLGLSPNLSITWAVPRQGRLKGRLWSNRVPRSEEQISSDVVQVMGSNLLDC